MPNREDRIRICQVTRRNMQFSFTWPNFKEELNPSKNYYIKISAFLLACGLMPISTVMHLIVALTENLNIYISEDIAVITSMFGIWYMATLYVRNQPNIANLLKDLSNFDKFGTPSEFVKINSRLNFFSWFAFMYPTIGSTSLNLTKLLMKSNCEEMNRKEHLDEKCGLMYPFWIPFEINYFPLFHFIFLYVWITATLFVRLHLSLCFQSLEIAQHIILRIRHLGSMIVESLENYEYKVSRKKVAKCIIYHQEILNMSANLDKSFSDLMFVHFVMTASICGCFEKQFVDRVHPLGAVVHLVGWIGSLFIASLGGQQLLDASESISEAIYQSKWYTADVKLQRDMLFMLIKSQNGLYITVGSFGVLSYPFFASVLKMSYSVLAMLTS